jgi:hypothetical protein
MVNCLCAQMLEIVPCVTNLAHNRGIMMHTILVGAVFVAMVLSPCVIAMCSRVDDSDISPESDVLEDGFI